MNPVAAVTLLLVLLLVVLLSIPVEFVFNVQKETGFKAGIRLSWLFGLVDRDLTRRRRRPPERVAKPAEAHPGKRKRNYLRAVRIMLAAIRTRSLLKRLVALFRDLIKSVRIKDLYLALRFGFDDPADTGTLFGAVSTLVACLQFSRSHLTIEPDFTNEVLVGRFRGAVSVRPIRLLYHLAAFAFSPLAIRAAIAMIKASRRRPGPYRPQQLLAFRV